MYAVEYTWISVPIPVTTRIIMAESGSSRKPQGTWKPPIPECVCNGIDGIHCATVTS